MAIAALTPDLDTPGAPSPGSEEQLADERALLQRFSNVVGIPLALDGLDELSELWRGQVDHAIADNDELNSYVRQLEARIDEDDAEHHGIVLGDDAIPSADEVVGEVEQFLREQDEGST